MTLTTPPSMGESLRWGGGKLKCCIPCRIPHCRPHYSSDSISISEEPSYSHPHAQKPYRTYDTPRIPPIEPTTPQRKGQRFILRHHHCCSVRQGQVIWIPIGWAMDSNCNTCSMFWTIEVQFRRWLVLERRVFRRVMQIGEKDDPRLLCVKCHFALKFAKLPLAFSEG